MQQNIEIKVSSKDPQRQQRKRNLFRLIDSFVPENIDIALQLIKTDQGLYQAAKQRYYPLMRLVDPKLGGGFKLLKRVTVMMGLYPDKEFTRRFVAHYASLGEREMVAKTVRQHPFSIEFIRNVALLNMLCKIDVPKQAKISYIDLPDESTPLQLPAALELLHHCKGLTCSNHAQYQAFEPQIPSMQELTRLAFNGCQLASLPDKIAGLQQLRDFRVNQNRFQEIPSLVRTFSNLTSLEIKDNLMQALPPWLQELTSLGGLTVDGNAISQLPDWIFEMPRLGFLSVEGNKLTELPDLQNRIHPKLEVLHLSNNPFGHFPKTLLSLETLPRLALNNCRLEAIPTGIVGLQQLEHLSLHNNPLKTLPEEIGLLPFLKTLDLRACPLRELPATFGNLSQLFMLDLRGTLIFELPDFLQRLEQLSYLRLNRTEALKQAAQTAQLKAWLPHCQVEFS